VPGRKPGKFLGRDMLPSTLLNGYKYQFKTRLTKNGIIAAAKRMKADPQDNIGRMANQRQLYCITRWKFQTTATKAEMEGDLDFYNAQSQQERGEIHRILQSKAR
jgi:hypothetical protein